MILKDIFHFQTQPYLLITQSDLFYNFYKEFMRTGDPCN